MRNTEKAIAKLYAYELSASENAYSPYSGARVGASVLDENGNIYTGCNVENASYSLTQCAERSALAAAVNAGMKPGTASTLLIYATGFEVLAPCGQLEIMCGCRKPSETPYFSGDAGFSGQFVLDQRFLRCRFRSFALNFSPS